MKYLILIALVVMSGCVNRGYTPEEIKAMARQESAQTAAETAQSAADKAKDKQIAQAASNLGPIAEVIDAKGQPDLSIAVGIQKRTIDHALNMPVSEYPLPTVKAADIIRDMREALNKYQGRAAELQMDLSVKAAEAAAAQKELEAAKAVAKAEKEKADSAARRELWWQIGGGVLTALGVLAGIASRLGLPYASLVESLMSVVNPMVKQRRITAETGLAAADVGRQTLGVVEQIIANKHPDMAVKLMEAVSAATGGRAESMSDLFKVAAKAYVTDTHGTQVSKVDNLLTDIRGRVLETAGGVAVAVSNVVKAN